jgi:hypothetical protein
MDSASLIWRMSFVMRRIAVVGLVLMLASALYVASAAPRDRNLRMERTPSYVLGYCKKSPLLPLACPHVLPRMSQPSPHWEANLCLVGHAGCAGLTWDDLSLVDGGYGTRPPIWSHVIVQAGNLARAFPFRYPTYGRSVTRLDGLFTRTRSRAIYIGTFTWGARRGTVVLAPDYPAGGEQGNHLIFRWRDGRTDFALGLHGWEPLSQAFAALRQMVMSI